MTQTPSPRIPPAVCQVVGKAVGEYHYSHARINEVFALYGAPGEPPEGSCIAKSVAWLKRASDDPNTNALEVLGGVLREVMEEPCFRLADEYWAKRKDDVLSILARHGMSYQPGGKVLTAHGSVPARSLEAILRGRDLAALEIEHKRAEAFVATDPPQAVTASCAILEALFKVYIEDENLTLPTSPTIKPLWGVVQKHLGLDPGRLADEDVKRVLSGLTSIVDGIGALRTHAGSAHGRGRNEYRVLQRHALLTVNAAFTLVSFILQTWDDRNKAVPSPGTT